ncbi:MAG: ABC transporter ATP-binding protein [Bryobacteraceae bacterium]
MSGPLIDVSNVSKTFRLHTGRKLIREQVRDWFRRSDAHRFFALRDVSFQIHPNESVAIVGANGAGKSTLLSLIAGVASPDQGTIRVNGRVAALLELGSGFHPDLTGEENVYLHASLLGFHREETTAMFDEIVNFAEIRDFIHEPLRTYSAGMVCRLAFAVAVHVNPGILIVDEVLGVGDAGFQEKCSEKIAALRREGKTLLCVSHSAATVTSMCDRAIWLEHGRVRMDGDARATVGAYMTFIMSQEHGVTVARG